MVTTGGQTVVIAHVNSAVRTVFVLTPVNYQIRVMHPTRLTRIAALGSGTAVTPTEVNGLTAAVVNLTLRGNPTRVMCVFLDKSAFLMADS